MGPEAMSCSLTPQASTPNLDALAAQGVRFTRCYTTAPVCSPSRSAFMTGMYATTIGAHNHRSHRDDGFTLPSGVRILPDLLREAGYLTANITQLPGTCGFRGTGKTDWNFTYKGRPFDSAAWNDLKPHQPFYAQVNFQETHRKYNAPRRADPAKVEIPPYYPDHPLVRNDWAQYLDSAAGLDRKIGLLLRQLEADGLADDSIILFFGDNGQSHVRGKQFCYEEGLHVPLIIRWPKHFPAPDGFKSGTVDDRFVEAIDLAATTLAMAGTKRPPKMQGRVFAGNATDEPRQHVFGARDRCDETVMRLRTVRDSRYRYIRNYLPDTPLLSPNKYKERSYPAWNLLKELHVQGKLNAVQDALCAPRMPAEELYDLTTDPHEIRNLADSTAAEHREALGRLRTVLDRWIANTNDQGRFLEPGDVAAAEGRTRPQTRPAGAAPAGRSAE